MDINNGFIRSFGRIKGRTISDKKENDLINLLPNYSISIEAEKIINNFEDKDNLWLEIGFGYGEHTYFQAKNNPNVNIIACEAYINGILSLLRKINDDKINNVKIFNGDARILLENLEDNSLERVFVLFPDPWPKKRHNKRRIINDKFLDVLSKKMKNGGNFLFASDIENYVEWTIDFAEKNENFVPKFSTIEDCKQRPTDWIITRYAEKAIKEGRELYFLNFLCKK